MKGNENNLKWLKILILLILAIGIFLRFVNLEEKVYWKDEVFTSLRVSGYTEQEVLDQIYDTQIIDIQDLQKYQSPNREKNVIDTIKGLAKEEAQLPPLYFVMARYWVKIFGNSVPIIRCLSVMFSLLAWLCLYLLCRELFQSPLIAWIAVSLMAVSPFYFLYAQEARQYSLWTLISLLSSWMLLRSLRVKTQLSWSIYAVTVILGLYTSPFSLFMTIGHGVYVVLIEKLQFNKNVKNYLYSLFVGIVVFLPWIGIIIIRWHQIKGRTSWSSISYKNGFSELVFHWFRNVARVFFDFANLNYSFEYTYKHPLFYLTIVLPFIFLIGYSFYSLYRNSNQKTWLFIFTFLGSTALPIILADLILGGRRSGTARYLLPSYLAIQISFAYFIANNIKPNLSYLSKLKLGKALMVVIFSIGILSCANISPKHFWWNKDPSRYFQNPEITLIINQSKNPLLISDASWNQIITLTHSLKPEVKLELVGKLDVPNISNGFSDYFLYKPSQNLRDKLEQNDNYSLNTASNSKNSWLWRLTNKIN